MVATAQPTPTQAPPSPPPSPLAVTDDPFDAADKATWDPTFRVFGQVQAETWFCVLQKGVGKVAFDANQHDVGDRRVAIKIAIVPAIAGRQTIERELIAESQEWTKIVNPSIKALGPQWNLKALHNQWVEAEMAASGRKYQQQQPDGSYVERDATTVRFVRIFPTEDACVQATQARGGGGAAAPAAVAAQPAAPVQTARNDAEKRTATAFLVPLWKAANGDIARFDELLKKNALTAKYFDLNSPEVLAVVTPPTNDVPF